SSSGAPPPGARLFAHPTRCVSAGEEEPSAPGGMSAIYRDLVADDDRTRQGVNDVGAALDRGRSCLVLTQSTCHVQRVAEELRSEGRDPVVLRGCMGAKVRAAAFERL